MILQSPFRVTPPSPLPFHQVLFGAMSRYGVDELAMVEEETGKTLTYGQIQPMSCWLANSLRNDHGLRKGDVVAVYLENRIEFVTLFLGVSTLGGILSGVNPLYNAEELLKHLNDSGARYVVTNPSLYKVLTKAAEGLPRKQLRTVFVVNDDGQLPSKTADGAPVLPFERLYTDGRKYGDGCPETDIESKRDPVLLPYSSGTSGTPKGVLLSHYNLQCLLSMDPPGKKVYQIVDHGDRTILMLPFFHMAGFMACIWAMFRGCRGYIMPKFDPAEYLRCIHRNRVSVLAAVPSVLVYMAKHASVDNFDMSCVKVVAFGAAPAGKELLETLLRRLPNVERITQGYGLTESGGLSAFTPAMHAKQCPIGSCGVPSPFAEIKVVSIDETNDELGPLEEGEIWIRGLHNMLGYHNKPEETRKTIDSDGWLHTGDIGYFDYFGHIYIIDRLKDLIKYKGFQVAPAELEDVLLKHSAVQEAAVIGIPDHVDADVGELPTAYIVLKPDYEASEATAISIKKIVEEHLAPFKHLRGGVVFVKQLPKGGTGKMLRRALRDLKEKRYGLHPRSKL